MPSTGRSWSDRQIDDIIGALLRIGVVASSVVVLLGGILYLLHHGGSVPHYSVFQGEPSDLRSLWGIAHDVLQFNSRGIIQFGLLLLIATPIVRVAFAALAFALQRDRTYVTVTLIVLALLLYSLTGGSH
jgi:uncharacterized membrane protein